MPEAAVLDQWVIYWNPSDYPDQYVVRRWGIGVGKCWPTDDVTTWDMLEEARMSIPADCTRIERASEDDPTIVEVWF